MFVELVAFEREKLNSGGSQLRFDSEDGRNGENESRTSHELVKLRRRKTDNQENSGKGMEEQTRTVNHDGITAYEAGKDANSSSSQRGLTVLTSST